MLQSVLISDRQTNRPTMRRILTLALCAAQFSQATTLTLDDAVERAIEQNFDLRINRLDFAQTEITIEQAEASFDPTLQSRINYNERLSPGNQTDQSGNSNPSRSSVNGGFSVNKRTSLGTQLTLSTDASYSSFSEDTTASVGLDIRQPLLAGAGKQVNLANLFRARARTASALLAYRSEVLDLMQRTIDAYYNIAFAQEELRLQQSSVEVAENLLKENERRFELGLATNLEVLQAQAALAGRQQDLLNVRLGIEAFYDDLWLLMGEEARARYPKESIPLPDAVPTMPAEDAWYAAVVSEDLDLQIIEHSLEILEMQRDIARRNLLPQLDLTLSARMLGRDSGNFEAFQSALERDGYSWGAGISVSVPWGRRADKALERVAILELRKENTRRDRLEYNKRKLARQVLRDLKATLAQLEISETQVRLQEQLFERERAGYRAGSETFRDVLQAQRDLDSARLNKLSTLQRLIRQDTLRSRLDQGLFERFNVSWETVPEIQF